MNRSATDDERYTRVAVFLHWLVAVLLIVQFAWGWWMQSIPKQPPGMRAEAYNLHKSVGLTILALMAVRLAWRLGHRPPLLPRMPRWQAALARFTHGSLYAALIVQPVTGYLGSVFSGYPVRYFGIVLPRWAARDDGLKDFFSDLHLVASWIIATLVVLHLAGIAQHLFERDGLISRMGIGR